MIRAILHLLNDQPLSVELLEDPKPSDIALLCTNIRTIDGKRPVFIDFSTSTFIFPMAAVRFVEIIRAGDEESRMASVGSKSTGAAVEEEEDLEIDEDFLRRIREAG